MALSKHEQIELKMAAGKVASDKAREQKKKEEKKAAAPRKAEEETKRRRDMEVVRRVLLEAVPTIKEMDHCSSKNYVMQCVYQKMEPALIEAKVGVGISVIRRMIEVTVNAYFQAKKNA